MPLTSTGFVMPTLEETKASLEAELLETVDPALDLSPDQPFGQIVGIFSSKVTEVYEIVQTLANSMNPGTAANFLLDNIAAITGTKREQPKKSTVKLNCVLGASFTAAAGAMTANVLGQPDVLWRNVGAVSQTLAGTYSIDFECIIYGPNPANAGTLTTITVPVAGWTSCTNPLDAVLGSFDEKDESLRKRREDELSAPGACTVDSIRADVLQVPGVQQCYVFENVTLATDANGLPGKSIEVVIYDGNTPAAVNADVAQTVWDGKPSGSETVGSTTVSVKDSQGNDRYAKFSRATVKNVWLEYDVVVDANFFPANGADLIKTAAALHGDTYQNLSVDVFAVRFKSQALTIPGVLDVPALRLGFTALPVGTANLTITGREIADIDTSRILVNVTTGSP